MMALEEKFSRTELLLGRNAVNKLKKCRVAVFGIGGVGGYAVEALARSGIGMLDLIDNDKVSISNINRQLCATDSTVGLYKTDVFEKRIHDINSECTVKTHKIFFSPDTSERFDFTTYDYIIDAIDFVSGKLEIIKKAKEYNVPVISSMGAGNRLDPTKFEVSDIYKTSVDPLARTIRSLCRKENIKSLKVVYSKEIPQKCDMDNGEKTIGSVSFVPSVAGLIIAGEVIKDLIK